MEAFKNNQQISSRETVDFGKVLFILKFHNSTLQLNKFIYYWEFQNKIKILQARKRSVTYKFVEEGIFLNQVLVKAHSTEGKVFSGNCNLTFIVKGIVAVIYVFYSKYLILGLYYN